MTEMIIKFNKHNLHMNIFSIVRANKPALPLIYQEPLIYQPCYINIDRQNKLMMQKQTQNQIMNCELYFPHGHTCISLKTFIFANASKTMLDVKIIHFSACVCSITQKQMLKKAYIFNIIVT